TFSGAISTSNLELAGGTADGTATFNGSVAWTGTDLVGGGTFTVGDGSTLTLSGASDKNLYHGGQGSGGRKLENASTLAWTGSGNLLLGDGAQIANDKGATFSIQNDATIGFNGRGNAGSVTNAGTFTKSNSNGTTTVAQAFSNSSLVHAQSGTLAFSAGVTSAGGEFRAASGAGNTFT